MTDQTPEPPQPAVDVQKRVEQFIKLRDFVKAMEDQQKEALRPAKETLEKLKGVLLGHLNATNQERAGCQAGTVYRTVKKSASIADKSAFWTYVVTQSDFDLIDVRANPTAVEEHIKTNGAPPPGVNWSTMETVGVQRSGGDK